MTLDAHVVDVSAAEESLVVGAMRRMAGGAAFRPDRQVLEGERSTFLRMALVADLVLGRVQPYLLGTTIVYVVAIAALDEAFVDAVVEGTVEVHPSVVVAAVAQFRRFRLQQKVLLLRVMGRVARNTGHIVLEVIGTQEIRVSVAMAAEASLTDLRRGRGLEDEDLRLVATPLDVRRSRAVAGFAAMPLLTGGSLQVGIPMLRSFDLLVFVCVAALAGVRANVLGRCVAGQRGRCLGSRVARLIFRPRRGGQATGQEKCCEAVRQDSSSRSVCHVGS